MFAIMYTIPNASYLKGLILSIILWIKADAIVAYDLIWHKLKPRFVFFVLRIQIKVTVHKSIQH